MALAVPPRAVAGRANPLPDAKRQRSPSAVRIAWGSASAAVVAVGYLMILLVNPRFFYQDDTEGGAAPIWIDVGESLRSGDLPIMMPGQWMAGNYAVEGQTGLFNPAQALISLLAPSVDNVALYATGVKLVFALILATGVYRLALEYGAAPHWAAAAGAAMPFSGFVLYYDSATWVTGFMGVAWGSQAWASLVRYSRGRSGPLPGFVFLYLALAVGYVHSAIMAGVVVGVMVLGEIAVRRWGCAIRLALLGASSALAATITYLPGFLTASVTWRGDQTDPLQNDGFLSAPWSETLAMSLPSHLPAIPGFAGPVHLAPVTYVAWFALPALAFVRWPDVAAKARLLTAPLAYLAVTLLMTAGPSLLGPLRWPARLLPYVALGVLLIVAVLLSRYRVEAVTPPRVAVAVGLLGVNVVRAASANPDLLQRHVITGLVVAGFTLLAVMLAHRLGERAVAVWLMISVLPVVGLMIRWHPENANVRQWNLPEVRSEAVSTFPDYPGATLQLGAFSDVPSEDLDLDGAWGDLVFGNYARLLQLDYVNAYTPVGFGRFSDLLCMNYDGSTCPQAYERVFEVESTTGRTIADLMALDRVVLQRAMFDGVPGGAPPVGWTVVDRNDQVIVLERDAPRTTGGARVAATQGVEIIEVLGSGGEHDHLTVLSPSGGQVVFSRLAWPGYVAMVGGEPATVGAIDDVFVVVEVPAGDDPVDLLLTYRVPGFRLGLPAAGAGLLLVAALAFEARRWRRPRVANGRHAAEEPAG